MNAVVERLLKLRPVEVEAVALVAELWPEGLPPDADGLLARAGEIESALEQAERLSEASKRIVELCSKLQPIPAPEPPPGF